jgi:hypothetical protein
MAPAVYGHCLGKVIGADGIKIPEKALAIESDVGELIREVVK